MNKKGKAEIQTGGYRNQETRDCQMNTPFLTFSVDIFAVTHPQDNNILSLKVKDNPVVADPKAKRAELWIREPLGISQRILFVALQGTPNPLFHPGVKNLTMSLTALRVYTSRYFNRRRPLHGPLPGLSCSPRGPA
jgi:hypothetical protein